MGLAVCVFILGEGGWEEGVAGCEGGVGWRGGGSPGWRRIWGGVSAVREGGGAGVCGIGFCGVWG